MIERYTRNSILFLQPTLGKKECWSDDDQILLSATLLATPTQRIAWLEEALQLAYATGALKPRRMLTKEEWDAIGVSNP